MTALPIDISLINNTLGISCIETHMIAIMRYLNISYYNLFINSFVKIDDTIKLFYDTKVEYSRYTGIERLQNTSKSLRLSELKVIDSPFDKLTEILSVNINNNIPILIEVDPLKLPLGSLMPNRSDHYVCIYGMENDNFLIIDDTPKRYLKLSKYELKQAYKGRIQVLNMLNMFNTNKYISECRNSLDYIVSGITPDTNVIKSLVPTEINNLAYFRDALAISKVSRERISLWLRYIAKLLNIDISDLTLDALDKTVKLIYKLYCTTETYRLRKKINYNYLNESLEQIFHQEEIWLYNLKIAVKKIRERI